jgi:hypothetical protein
LSFDGDLYPEAGASKVITSKGDLVRGDASGDRERYGIGSTGQILTVASGTVAWATAGGGVTTNIQSANLASQTSTTSTSFVSFAIEITLSDETGGVAICNFVCTLGGTTDKEMQFGIQDDTGDPVAMSWQMVADAGAGNFAGVCNASLSTNGSDLDIVGKTETGGTMVMQTPADDTYQANLVVTEIY